ncbi:MAG: VanZ family protein [Vicinamibacterales bacterium]
MSGAIGLLAIYLSLIPFELRQGGLTEGAARFRVMLTLPVAATSRADFIANLVFFTALGAFGCGSMALDRTRGRQIVAAAVTVTGVLCLSSALELAQLFFARRSPSIFDVAAGVTGGAFGAGLWLAVGQRSVDWLREGQSDRGAAGWLIRVLSLYTAALVVIRLLPFDFSVDVGELAAKFRAGRIVPIPFGDVHTIGDLFWALGWDAGTMAPVGALAVLAAARRGLARPVCVGIATGCFLVAALEVLQVFVITRYASITDVIVGALGILGGAAIVDRLAPAVRHHAHRNRRTVEATWAAALMVWMGALLVYHWGPFTFDLDAHVVGLRLRTLSLVPFAGYYASRPDVAMEQFIVKFALAAPGGFLLARRLSLGRDSSNRIVLVLVGMIAVALLTIVEAVQVLLPGRVPDLGDIVVGVAGALAGAIACSALKGTSTSAAETSPARGGGW